MTPTSSHPPRLHKVSEAAEIMNTSVKTVYRRIRTGELPAYRENGILRIHPDDLARYIAARRSH